MLNKANDESDFRHQKIEKVITLKSENIISRSRDGKGDKFLKVIDNHVV